jgi:rod shape-determining protein MreD
MNKGIVWHIVAFVSVVIVQALIMNELQFSGYVNPYFYVLFIIILPFNTPRFLLLLLGFLLGLTIDMFTNTPGIHASATVFISFLRPFILNSSSFDEHEKMNTPTIGNIGLKWFMKYAALFIILHHLFLFYIEVFSFNGFLFTLLRCVLSSLFTFVIILISQYLVFRK